MSDACPEVSSEKEVVSGGTYTLKMEDGRAGELRIDKFALDDSDKVRATFVGAGSLNGDVVPRKRKGTVA
jgi:hypothetical protein